MMRRRLLYEIEHGGLPSEYTSIEYIQSTGTQYIDTGVIPDSNTDVLLTKGATSGSYINCLFGANSSATNQYTVNATGMYFYGRNNSVSGGAINPAGTIKVIGGKLYHNDTLLLDFSGQVGNSSQNMLIFARNSNQGLSERFISMKVYTFKMWQSSDLIRNMMPCIRIADSKPGMYDLVNQTFYVNQGTGEFITP